MTKPPEDKVEEDGAKELAFAPRFRPKGGDDALHYVERLKDEPARFSCLGLGFVPFLLVVAAAVVLWWVMA